MKEKEEVHTQVGVDNLPRGLSDAGNKALQIFTKLKRRANAAPSNPPGPVGEGTPIRELDPNIAELQQSAMNYIDPEVIKTESRWHLVKLMKNNL